MLKDPQESEDDDDSDHSDNHIGGLYVVFAAHGLERHEVIHVVIDVFGDWLQNIS